MTTPTTQPAPINDAKEQLTKAPLEDVMRIHGHWYDVSDFNHPGGPLAIGLGKGRDATALFEAHHPFTSRAKLGQVLKKYEVTDASKIEQCEASLLDPRERKDNNKDNTEQTFAWGSDFAEPRSAFARQVQEEVADYFRRIAKKRGVSLLEASKATPFRWFEMIFLIVAFVASLPFFVQGYWWTLIVTPILSWVCVANTVHDACHFSISTNWKINCLFSYLSPWTSSPTSWYLQHVVGHHAYPNVANKDPDLAHAPAFMRVHHSITWKPLHRFQMIATAVIWTLGTTLYMTVVPLKALALGVLNRAVYLSRSNTARKAMHVSGRLLTAALLWVWPWFIFDSYVKALIWCTVPMFLHSMCFMLATQINHLTPQNAVAKDEDYFIHQVVTSHSFEGGYLGYIFLGGLNYQIEHHLFPTVNHCHLVHIRGIVKRLCEKHDIPYHESSGLFEALSKYVTHIHQMAQNPKKKH